MVVSGALSCAGGRDRVVVCSCCATIKGCIACGRASGVEAEGVKCITVDRANTD